MRSATFTRSRSRRGAETGWAAAAPLLLPLLLLLLLLVAGPGGCSGDDAQAPLPFDPGGCGLTGYTWLPRGQVGAVLDHDEDALSPMDSVTVDGFISVVSDALSPVPYGARLFTLRYTTQDKGRVVEATGLVGVPWTEEGLAGDFPVILFHHGTTGFSGDCAPSTLGAENNLLIYLTASLGYVVFAPDYIGLDPAPAPDPPPGEAPVTHAYISVEQTAIGALDMLRAGRAFVADQVDTGVRPSRQVVLMGASQGGHAVFATERLAPYYAPEVDVCCGVAMIPVTDLYAFAQHALSGMNPGTQYLAAILTAQHRWYEGVEPLSEVFTDASPLHVASAVPEAMDTTCDADSAFGDATRIEDLFAPTFVSGVRAGDWDALGPWSCYLRESSIATTSIPRASDTPLLVVYGEEDHLIDTPTQAEDFDRLCGQGYRMELLECAGAGHADAALWSLPEQIAWIQDRLAGAPLDPARQCVRTAPIACSAQP